MSNLNTGFRCYFCYHALLYTNADVLGTVLSVILGVTIVIIALGVLRLLKDGLFYRRGSRERFHR